MNKDSYVWDFATGSAGLLVAAMNVMIDDAKANIQSPDEFKKKEAHIKANQLLGLEILPSIYMLAILNMILMGDGSSNIINKDNAAQVLTTKLSNDSFFLLIYRKICTLCIFFIIFYIGANNVKENSYYTFVRLSWCR